MTHPTQVFLSNPQALRVEYRLDDARLELWWSPLSGHSTDCSHRNFSSRDAHLKVFDSITLPGCALGGFLRCDYDPYHCVLHWENQSLHIALRPDLAAVLLWTEQPQVVDFKTHRDAQRLTATTSALTVAHTESDHAFEFAAALAPSSDGAFRHGPSAAPAFPRYSRAELAPRQLLVIGVGLAGDDIATRVVSAASLQAGAHLAATNAALATHERTGAITSSVYPEFAKLRRLVIRGLHSMIDESAAYRASIKAIYYLIWVRDSGFSFAYQAAAGWPHKLPELCRLLLDNPRSVTDAELPNTRMFGQLINRALGKLEEDGLYYVVWTLFTQWTQNGKLDFMSDADWELIDEALAWVEAVTWDADRGLFGEYTADETPAFGSHDQHWDHAIGQPSNDQCIRHDGQPVTRNYDVYFNTCMHSTYRMLAALLGQPAYLTKAEALWPELQKLLLNRTDGVPTYGELLLQDGGRVQPPYWGPDCGASCCVWGLTMPNFTPLADWDSVWAATLDAIIAKPDMHFMNGICSAMTAVDPWLYPESKLLALHQRVVDESNRPGKYLPMGGAMPEKFNAPQGNLYHDIRPQGFAMGAWLAACSALGLRRLPHGLALRPTAAYECIEAYQWRGKSLTIHFGPSVRQLAVQIDGQHIEGTLQLPETSLREDSIIRLVSSDSTRPLWLRSSVQLDCVDKTDYAFTAHGLSSITFSAAIKSPKLTTASDLPIDATWSSSPEGLWTIHFTHFGSARLQTETAIVT